MAGFFGFFDYSKPGRGVSKDEPEKTGVARFFFNLYQKFFKLIELNLLYSLFSLPILLALYFIFTVVLGMFVPASADVTEALPVFGMLFAVIYVAIIGSGLPSAGFWYSMRNFSRGDHSWIWSDNLEHIKNNWKQALAVFFIDLIVTLLLVVAFCFYFLYDFIGSALVAYAARGFWFAAMAIFSMMHAYIYIMMVTFDLKLRDIYKNAFLLTMAHLPKNLGMLAIEAFICIGWVALMIEKTVFIILVPLLLFSLVGYVGAFFSYPLIKKYMMKDDEDDDEISEKVFVD